VVGRRRMPDRQEREERGREEEEDSIRSELLRSPKIARVARDRERRLLSPPPVETETRISFPTSRGEWWNALPGTAAERTRKP
jgi:hypothetical protein